MGFAIHGHKKRDVDSEKHLRRLHKTVPLIESPLRGADHEKFVFSQRHEANTVELFFDLFFVANLATFTTYHSVTDHTYLLAYIGFFGILWSCWFQVTLHDVRFARDSIYERACKLLQFIVFVGLALVGSSFNPNGEKGDAKNFRILCYTLIISRGTLAIQYLVVLFYTWRARYSKIYLPLGLMVGIYAAAAGVFGGMIAGFEGETVKHRQFFMVWYIIMVIEAAAVVTISCTWRMLSFKKTHLMERMSLLTLIVIGEGAIGVTKTVSRLMGKNGLDVEGSFLVMAIILVLVLLWALYFDNFPHGHYGTIRQQIWSLLHFPLQLAIVGLVEGSQQLALARYVNRSYMKIDGYILKYCMQENYDGAKLRDKMLELLNYFQFTKKLETYDYQNTLAQYIYKIGNSTGICSKANATEYASGWPTEFFNLEVGMFNGVYLGLGVKLPVSSLEKESVIDIALESWKIVYIYFWGSFCIVIGCSIAFLLLIRRHKIDLFDWVSVIWRVIVLAVGGLLIAIVHNHEKLYQIVGGVALIPLLVVLLISILLFDRLSASFSNWRLKKSGAPYAKEYEEEHHGHDHGHGEAHEHDPHDSHHGHINVDNRKSAAWSVHSGVENLHKERSAGYDPTQNTAYDPHHGQSYAMTPLMSPPLQTPDASATFSPPLHQHGHSGGYMPVNRHEGA